MTAFADLITCPNCGTENPAHAMKCKKCQINLMVAAHESAQAQAPSKNSRTREFALIFLGVVSGSCLVFGLLILFFGISTFGQRYPSCPACEAMGQFFALIGVGLGVLSLIISSIGLILVARAQKAQWK